MHNEVRKIIDHYNLERIPLEGTLYKKTYTGLNNGTDDVPAGTAIIGLYCNEPESSSKFHRLSRDETWHFYKGDPFILYLLYEDGSYREVIMGTDIFGGQQVQFTVPAGVWQAGGLMAGSNFALFGCTVAPGFTGDCFEMGIRYELLEKYPGQKDIIIKFSDDGNERNLPDGYRG